MIKIYKIAVVAFSLFLLQSCKNEISCSEPVTNIGRTCKLKLNKEAKRSLNTLAEILSELHDLQNTDEKSGSAKVMSNEIFFNLDKSDNLYFKLNYYKDYYKEIKPTYHYYEVPIEQLNPENITITELGLWQYGANSIVTINSKFSNDKAFSLKFVKYDKDNNLVSVECLEKGEIGFLVRREDAEKLKNAFITFINNYKK